MSVTRILIFLGLVALGFAGYRIARSGGWPFRREKAAAPAPRRAATPAPRVSAPAAPSATAPPATAPASRPIPAERSSTAAPPNTAAAPAVRPPEAAQLPESRGGSMISKDWDGRTPTYMIHFSSYQRRENAERDRARLSKLFGRQFRIIGVNLGREGFWFRVMLGDFASRDEALAFREQLSGKSAEKMGLVYKVSGTR